MIVIMIMPTIGEAFIIARDSSKYFMWIVSFMCHNNPMRQVSSLCGRRLEHSRANELASRITSKEVVFKATSGIHLVLSQKQSADKSGAILHSSSFTRTNRKWV